MVTETGSNRTPTTTITKENAQFWNKHLLSSILFTLNSTLSLSLAYFIDRSLSHTLGKLCAIILADRQSMFRVPGTVLSFHTSFHLSIPTPLGVGTLTFPTSQRRKLKAAEIINVVLPGSSPGIVSKALLFGNHYTGLPSNLQTLWKPLFSLTNSRSKILGSSTPTNARVELLGDYQEHAPEVHRKKQGLRMVLVRHCWSSLAFSLL